MTSDMQVAGRCANSPGRGRSCLRGTTMPSVRCLPGCVCGRHSSGKPTATCETCGQLFERRIRRKGKPQRFCSFACRDASYRTLPELPQSLSCLICETTFIPRRSRGTSSIQRFCSLACRDESYKREPHRLTCEQCGVEFVDKWHCVSRPRRFCSMPCHQASQRIPDRLHRRKAIMQVYREPYSRFQIARRDGWRCQLCGKKVDPNAQWPNPGFGSIDHIIPIAEGGADAPANVQLAHLRCNLSKGTRALPQGEQLRLIG